MEKDKETTGALPTGLYRHYKGVWYLLLGVGQHTESGEVLAVYIPLSGENLDTPRIRCRPLEGPEGFLTVNAEGEKRFTHVPMNYLTK